MPPQPLVIDVIDTLSSRQCELDLAQVPFADSTALNALLRHRRDALAEGGTLRVVAISPAVQRLLEITGTTELLTADPSSEQPGTAPS